MRLSAIRLAFALALLAGGAEAAQRIDVRAGAHDDFGRIVFDWPSAPKHTARIDGSHLIIEFDEPFEADYAEVRRHLYRYIADIETSADGQRVSMSLLRPMTLQAQTIEGALVFDLAVDKAATTSAAAAKPAPAKAPAPATTVRVRAGEHPTYSRLVFDWRRNVGYRVEREGERVIIRFDRPARLALGNIAQDPPRHVGGLSSAPDGDATAVSVTVAGSARLRHFRSGTSIVLDVLGDVPAAKTADASDAAPAPAAAAQPPAPAAKPNNLLARTEDKPADAPAASAAKEDGHVAATKPTAKTENEPAQSAAKADGPAMPAQPTVPVKVEKAAPPPAAPTKAAELAGPVTRTSGDGQVQLTIAETPGGVDLAFTWADVVPAAAFMRASYLWLVFDRVAELDLRGVAADTGIVYADQLESANATVVRLRPRDGLHAEMRRDGATWTVRLAPDAGAIETDLLGVVQEDDAGASRMFIPVIDSGARIVMYDPEVGDELIVVPLQGSGIAVAQQREYVDFRLLATAQGVAIRPNVDSLDVKPLRKGVAIAGDPGLAVTSAETRAKVQHDPTKVNYKASLKRPILLFETWRGEEGVEFNDRREALQRVLARAPRGGRNIARMELAKFYLSHGMAPEAAAFLQMVEAEDGGIVADPTFLAMRGVANLLLHHLEVAAADLNHPKLKLYPDVALWRGALLAAQERYEDASQQFALGAGFLPSLDQNFQRRLAISWAVAAANGGSESDFLAAADRLGALESRPDIDGTLAYLQGRRAEALEQGDEAIGYYDAAIQSHYRPMRAYAALRKTNLELELGRVDGATALDQLEGLRFAWRGDNFELSLINRIVDLRIDQKDYAEALQLLRDTTAVFPENEITKAMAQRLNSTFEDLFLHGKADDLPPVTALALFYEFQELTPLGEEGDGMIQRLADRLTEVDLLGSAAELLEHQIAYRLRGAEKARVGARLAVIYLLDGQPQKAFDTLESTATPLSSDEMERERRYLQARALSELGKPDNALALLKDDERREADMLRADIFWRSRRWEEAAATTERLLGARWQDDAPLGEGEQNQVIQLTVAYYMAGGSDHLERIAGQYTDKMAQGPMADTFRVLTHHVDPASTEFRQLASEIARVADLESFMAGYRDRLKSGGLSALN